MTKPVSVFRSLRFRITALAMIVIVAVLVLVALGLGGAVRQHALNQVDTGLINGSVFVKSQIHSHAILSPTGPRGQLGQVVLPDGRLIGSSTNFRGQPPLVSVRQVGASPTLVTVDNPRFGPLRVLAVELNGRGSAVLIEAQQVGQIVDEGKSLSLFLAIFLPILAILLGLLIWVVVGLAMKPVGSISAAVDEISEGSLDERLPSPRTGDELEGLVDTMNSMLGRLQEAIKRERRFIADASHELKTPIAAMRTALEAGDDGPSAGEVGRSAALSSLQILEMLAEDLLLLGSDQNAATGAESRPIDIDELVFEKADQLRRSTRLEIDTSKVSGGQVLAREIDMMRVIDNLASNAVRHADSYVGITMNENQGTVRLAVSDDGAGIPAEFRETVFERFVRIEGDRNRVSGGTGLGLSIVSDIVTRYGGTVRVTTSARGGATFVVEMPATVPTRSN
jgi:signal transduction histidine kinase